MPKNSFKSLALIISFIALAFISGCTTTETPQANLIITAEPVKDKVHAGAPVEVKLSLKNNGTYPIGDVFVYINKLNSVKEIGNLNPGEKISLSVIGNSPREKGNFYINVTGTFKDKYGERHSNTRFKIESWLPRLNVTHRIFKSSEEVLINVTVQNLENVSVIELFVKINAPEAIVTPDFEKILRLDPKDTCECEVRTDIKEIKFNVRGEADNLEIIVSNRYGVIINKKIINLS